VEYIDEKGKKNRNVELKDLGVLNEFVSLRISISGGLRWALSFSDSQEVII
jgi:hypothetical protein